MAPATAIICGPADTTRKAAMPIAASGKAVSPSITGAMCRDILPRPLTPSLTPARLRFVLLPGNCFWNRMKTSVREAPVSDGPTEKAGGWCPPAFATAMDVADQATEARTFGSLSEKISSIWFSVIISGGESAIVSAVMRTSRPTSWKPFSMAL